MTTTWGEGHEPEPQPISLAGWVRITLRAVVIVTLIVLCLALLLLLRLVERPIYGLRRPITPHITQFVCRSALRILRLPLRVHGQPLHGRAAVVANHTSWLDIFVLNASKRIFFVSKSEVAGWPGIGCAGPRDRHAVYQTRTQRGIGPNQNHARAAVGRTKAAVLSPKAPAPMACRFCRLKPRCLRPLWHRNCAMFCSATGKRDLSRAAWRGTAVLRLVGGHVVCLASAEHAGLRQTRAYRYCLSSGPQGG